MLSFSDTTNVNKNVPKNAFYKHLEVNSKLKQVFVNDVDRITWAYKFATSTLNVADGKDVHEITVFAMLMKRQICPTDMLVYLDKNIPRHTLFILSYNDKSCAVINFKEAVTNNNTLSYKVTNTYQTDWLPSDQLALKLEGTTMDALYENFVRQLAGNRISEKKGTLKEDIATSQEQQALKKEIETLKKRAAAERQPQKKFMLHKQIKELENKLK